MPAPKFFKSAKTFRAWLETNAATSTELIVGYYKVNSGLPSMTWPESVDEALCFGWIDGVRRSIGADAYSIRFTPRKPTSIWSKINIAKVEQLRAQGRMTPAGKKAYALRKAEKSVVYAYEQTATPELSAAELRVLKGNKAAYCFFEASPPGYKKGMLHWITTAKRPETRASRIAKLIAACVARTRLR